MYYIYGQGLSLITCKVMNISGFKCLKSFCVSVIFSIKSTLINGYNKWLYANKLIRHVSQLHYTYTAILSFYFFLWSQYYSPSQIVGLLFSSEQFSNLFILFYIWEKPLSILFYIWEPTTEPGLQTRLASNSDFSSSAFQVLDIKTCTTMFCKHFKWWL